MIALYGHASNEEVEEIRQVERRAAVSPDPETLLELGALYIEPAHREAESIRLFEAILKEDPSDNRARLWLAYCCIHYLMDEQALRRVLTLMDELEGDERLAPAAFMLRAEALEDLGELSTPEKIRLLERSVKAGSDWVTNRERLALTYGSEGRHDDALHHIQVAIANLEAFSSQGGSVEERIFEDLITGRSRSYLQEELNQRAADIKARSGRVPSPRPEP